MSAARALITFLSLLWVVTTGLVWVTVLHPIFRRKKGEHWVFGGHRGRWFSDNARYAFLAAKRRGIPAVFVANSPLYERLREEGHNVERRHSLRARALLSRSGALIYSHGEDDLDLLLLLLRGRTSPRFYLNHGLNFLKAGGVLDPSVSQSSRLLRSLKTALITDCDVFLCASPAEQAFLSESYPMHADKLSLGGGAHLDAFSGKRSAEKRIYWFPTFRENARDERALTRMITRVTSDPRLLKWLTESGYEFVLGVHINHKRLPELRAPFRFVDASHIARDLLSTEVLISDYSSISFSFLTLDRPLLLFPFDLPSYLSTRRLHQSYETLDFAPQVSTAEELVQVLVSETFRDPKYEERRRAARARLLPGPPEHSYADDTVTVIASRLEDERSAPDSRGQERLHD